MECPYCGRQMTEGQLLGHTKGSLRFLSKENAQKSSADRFWDSLGGVGLVKGAGAFSGYRIDAQFCRNCKKMILDVDIDQ